MDDSERECMHLNVDESGVVGSSVLWNIIVKDLVNLGPERPAID